MINNHFTAQYFLSLFERLLPREYLSPIEEAGPGYEIFQTFAAIGERISLATFRLDEGLYAITAPEASFASVEIELSRTVTPAVSIAFTQKKGSLVETAFGGRRFELFDDVLFGEAEEGPKTVTVKAIFASYQWNVLGEEITPDAEVFSGEINSLVFPIQDPPFAEKSVIVRQFDDALGGVPGMLEQIGLDRGIARVIGESADAYRFRISALPDTVSPAAMKRNIDIIWLPIFQSYDFIETWNVTYQSCYDAPENPIDGSAYDPSTFVYDDPRPKTPFRNRWLDDIEFRGAFIVVLPRLGSFSQRSIAMDDSSMLNFEFLTENGKRAWPAFDVTSDLPAVGIFMGAFDGYDAEANAFYGATFSTLQQIKPAGVAAILELQGN
jgi:hypothetical protein